MATQGFLTQKWLSSQKPDGFPANDHDDDDDGGGGGDGEDDGFPAIDEASQPVMMMMASQPMMMMMMMMASQPMVMVMMMMMMASQPSTVSDDYFKLPWCWFSLNWFPNSCSYPGKQSQNLKSKGWNIL